MAEEIWNKRTPKEVHKGRDELSYNEIARIADSPLGTVMSRLSRARRQLYAHLSGATGEMSA